MWLIIIISIFSVIGLIWLAIGIASCQNSAITHCFKIKKMHDNLLVGEAGISNVSNSDLLSLRFPIFTYVGMGGFGPYYNPSFEIFSMVTDELALRRNHESD